MAGRSHFGSRQTAVRPDGTYEESGGSSVAGEVAPAPVAPAPVAPAPVAPAPVAPGDRLGTAPRGGSAVVYPLARGAGNGGLAAGLGLVGLLTIVIGAWGGIVPYLGPTFGYHANGSGSWVWDWQHSLLYLIPGAVVVVMGLWIWGLAARTRAGSGRFGSALAALVLLAAGAWFALGPVVWPIFYSTAVFGPASPTRDFLNQVGYNLGPGLILVALGGITLASAATRRRRPL